MGSRKNRWVTRILAVGAFAAVVLVLGTRWIVWENRFITDDEIYAKEEQEYEKKNAAYLARLRGPIRKLTTVDEIYQTAAKAVWWDLFRIGENPGDYRVKVFEEENGAVFRFSVEHIDGIKMDTTNMLGNPSGKDRWVLYDNREGRIIYNRIQQ